MINKKMKEGFSLAEMLIVILIFSIVVAAVAPGIVNKQLKRDTTQVPHGIVECYWKGGKLFKYEASNKDKASKNGTTIDVTSAGSCSFVAPNASYYRIQLVGAGGQGYNGEVGYSIFKDGVAEQGSVSIKNLASTSLPSWVVQNWGTQRITVTMKSPVGGGGRACCDTSIKNTPECNSCHMASQGCHEDCRIQIKHTGGDSGTPTKREFTFNLLPTDKISYYVNDSATVFSHKNTTYKLTTSGDGKDADENGDGDNGTNSTGGTLDLARIVKGQEWQGDFCTEYNKIGEAGSISISPSSTISYYKDDYSIEVELGKNGNKGSVTNFTYPNLGGKTLTLIPAKDAKEDSILKIGKFELTSKSGKDDNLGIMEEKQVITDFESWTSSTSPVGYNPKNKDLVPTESEMDKAINDTGLKSGMEDNNIKPGIPGQGSYPYIKNINYTSTLKVGAKNSSFNKNFNLNQNEKCLDDSTPKRGSNGQYYCSGQMGTPGAVRIVW